MPEVFKFDIHPTAGHNTNTNTNTITNTNTNRYTDKDGFVPKPEAAKYVTTSEDFR